MDNFISYIFTFHDQKVVHEVMQEQYRYLYKKEIDGAFRGEESIALMCFMAMAQDSEMFFKQVESVFDKFSVDTFYYNPVSVGIMIQDCRPNDAQNYVDRTYELYNRLKKMYKSDITKYNLPGICALALTDRLLDDLVGDFESIYKLKGVNVNRALRSLGEPYVEDQVIELFEKKEKICKMLKKKRHPMIYLAFLEVLASRPESVESIVNLIIEADDYLKPNKDFHGFFVNTDYRSMVAAALVHKYLIDKNRVNREFSIDEKIAHYKMMLMFQNASFDESSVTNTGGDC